MKKFFQGILAFLILALGVAVAFYLVHTKPRLKKRKPPRYVPLVEVEEVRARDWRVEIREFGTVRPVRTGEIVPEVSGRIIYLSPNLVAGGRFRRGEVLVRLDPVDYETQVALAEGELREAEKTLAEVEAEAQASLEEWREVLHQKAPPPPLVAREPQLLAAKARVQAARAKLRQAKVDLSRTVIRAPFDGLVVEQNVDLGQYVSPGVVLAKVYETKALEVAVPLEVRELRWLKIPGFNTQGVGSKAEVLHPGLKKVWSGRVVRAAAEVDEKTRLLTVFVRVKDPLATKPPLLPGMFVQVRFKGALLRGVFVLPRDYLSLRKGRYFLYLVDSQQRLEIRPVEVLLFTKTEAIIKSGLKDGERVVVSTLKAPVAGMKVRLKGP